MSCDICDSSSCCVSFHSIEEQHKYSEVIELFEKARDLRTEIQEAYKEEE